MSEKLPDRRLAKTRDALARALFSLLQHHAWEEIGIVALCAEATVARSSFYAHFTTKTELLDYVISKQMREVADIAGTGGRHPARLVAWLLDHATQNRALFQRVATSADAQVVMARFRSALAGRLRADLVAQGNSTSDTVIAFVLGGVFEALQEWARTWQLSRLDALKADTLHLVDAVFAAAERRR